MEHLWKLQPTASCNRVASHKYLAVTSALGTETRISDTQDFCHGFVVRLSAEKRLPVADFADMAYSLRMLVRDHRSQDRWRPDLTFRLNSW